MNKENWIKLAKGYIAQEAYEDEFRDKIGALARKHDQEQDFLGLPFGTNAIMSPVLDALGEDFSYFHYECADDFDRFNKNTTLADDTHPNVHSLEDLFEFAKDEETGLVIR